MLKPGRAETNQEWAARNHDWRLDPRNPNYWKGRLGRADLMDHRLMGRTSSRSRSNWSNITINRNTRLCTWWSKGITNMLIKRIIVIVFLLSLLFINILGCRNFYTFYSGTIVYVNTNNNISSNTTLINTIIKKSLDSYKFNFFEFESGLYIFELHSDRITIFWRPNIQSINIRANCKNKNVILILNSIKNKLDKHNINFKETDDYIQKSFMK